MSDEPDGASQASPSGDSTLPICPKAAFFWASRGVILCHLPTEYRCQSNLAKEQNSSILAHPFFLFQLGRHWFLKGCVWTDMTTPLWNWSKPPPFPVEGREGNGRGTGPKSGLRSVSGKKGQPERESTSTWLDRD